MASAEATCPVTSTVVIGGGARQLRPLSPNPFVQISTAPVTIEVEALDGTQPLVGERVTFRLGTNRAEGMTLGAIEGGGAPAHQVEVVSDEEGKASVRFSSGGKAISGVEVVASISGAQELVIRVDLGKSGGGGSSGASVLGAHDLTALLSIEGLRFLAQSAVALVPSQVTVEPGKQKVASCPLSSKGRRGQLVERERAASGGPADGRDQRRQDQARHFGPGPQRCRQGQGVVLRRLERQLQR